MRLRKNNDFRVLRGGSYYSGPWFLRCSNRHRYAPKHRGRNFGFRFVVRRKT